MPVPHHSVLTGRIPFLLPNQQCQSTEGLMNNKINLPHKLYKYNLLTQTDAQSLHEIL